MSSTQNDKEVVLVKEGDSNTKLLSITNEGTTCLLSINSPNKNSPNQRRQYKGKLPQ